ncbi:MAG: DUF4013 domain-containing protein [Candidatus Diapherotrites archaeon]
MVDYAAAIKKPFSDMQTLGIGIILGFIPVISLLVNGYGIGVARKVVNKDNKLPKWDPGKIVQYVKDFIVGMVISIIYLIPAAILVIFGGIAIIGPIISAAMGGEISDALAGQLIGSIAAGGILFILAIILAIIGGLFATMGIIFYAKTGSIGAAFSFGAILKKILTGTFLAAFVIYIVYAIVLAIIMGVLSIIPFLGSLIGLGLLTYATSVTGQTLFAQVFNETP